MEERPPQPRQDTLGPSPFCHTFLNAMSVPSPLVTLLHFPVPLVALPPRTLFRLSSGGAPRVLCWQDFFEKLLDYMCSGPVVVMVWEGTNVIAGGRKVIPRWLVQEIELLNKAQDFVFGSGGRPYTARMSAVGFFL